ncbi:hypothetical protein D770_24825 [Flammeovirgaceae bacterium 311]|nr:hypothetical protein D770_24825 [Flammeovirgaceae bacterium 311]
MKSGIKRKAMENIGFKSIIYSDFIEEIKFKKDLLYFDKLMVDEEHFSTHFGLAKSDVKLKGQFYDNFVHNSNEIDFLISKDLLEITNTDNLSLEFTKDEGSAYLLARKLGVEFLEKRGEELMSKDNFDPNEEMAAMMYYSKLVDAAEIRMFCGLSDNRRSYTPIIDFLDLPKSYMEKRSSIVLELVLKKFPMPSSSCSWEEIIDFKENEDVKRKLLALKHWIIEISNTSLTKNEIEQKLEYLVHEYEHSMKLSKMKYEVSNIELFLTTTIGLIENIVKINWSKAVQLIFEIKKKKVDLLLEERSAPGRELEAIS